MIPDAREAVAADAASVPDAPAVIMLPAASFMGGCAIAAAAIVIAGQLVDIPSGLLTAEVLATILGLFLFGSFRFQIHKNALTFGMLLVIAATFSQIPTSTWHAEIAQSGWQSWARHHVWSFAGLDDLIHADTMLFILGLTLFVSVISQTRLLEGLSFRLLRRYRGAVLPTVIAITLVVSVASGVLDGVSMIGLTIRTLVIIMLLAATPLPSMRYAVMLCTNVTTICGVWLAYGEPPNLIMKANLDPHLGNAFFLLYCAPAAVVSYLVITSELRGRFGPERVDMDTLDILDAKAADVRFLQASRHGDVMTPVELIDGHASILDGRGRTVIERLRLGESLGIAMIRADVPQPTRRELLAHYVSEELADGLDNHYILENAGQYEAAFRAELAVDEVLASTAAVRRRAQTIGAFALVPFALLLIVHGVWHAVPLFLASFAAFAAALPGIASIPRMRRLALRDAYQEYAEYYFLFPLFLSITLLTSAGFFDRIQGLIRTGIEAVGPIPCRVCPVPRQHGSVRHARQQRRRRLRIEGAPRARHRHAAPVCDGADCRLCPRRMLDPYRLCAVRGRVCLHSARRRRSIYAHPVDPRHDAGHPEDPGRTDRSDVCREPDRVLVRRVTPFRVAAMKTGQKAVAMARILETDGAIR